MTGSITPATTSTSRLGLPLLAIVGLALLACLRGLVHDLHLVESGTPLTLVFALVPLVVWVTVAVLWSRRPFVSLLAAGVVLGVLSGAIHIVLWSINLTGSGLDEPALGGNLAGVLSPEFEAVLLRAAAFVSSFLVGVMLGAVAGLIAWAIRRIPTLASLPFQAEPKGTRVTQR